jgi:hypothetical protein
MTERCVTHDFIHIVDLRGEPRGLFCRLCLRTWSVRPGGEVDGEWDDG